jgi:hypothetical protein
MKTIFAAALLVSTAVTAPAMAQTTIDFEGYSNGTTVGSTYAAQGIVFTDAEFKQCGGGCPTPAFGIFISSANYSSPITATFTGTARDFSFANVSNSGGTAVAYGSGGTLLETINFAAYPGSFSFTSNNIASVVFSGSQFGVDNFSYTLNGAVPEPATWALMILGFGAVGGAMRRRQSVAARVRFA